MRAPVNRSELVTEERTPIFFSGAPATTPAVAPGTRNALMPRGPGSPVLAISRKKSAMDPWVIQAFSPSTT